MARHVQYRLTEAQVRSAPAGKHCDGGGLWLEVKATGARRWFLRYQFGTLRREAGIGPYPEVTREAARAEAGRLRALLSGGQIRSRKASKTVNLPSLKTKVCAT